MGQDADPRDPQVEEEDPRLSADPDPDADVAPEAPAGLGEPAEDPDPPVGG